MQSHPSHVSADDEISLLDLWRIVRKGWLTIFATAFVVGGATAVASLLMTPIYRAEAIIMETERDNQPGFGSQALLEQFGGFAELAGINISGLRDTSAGGRTLIQSRTFVEDFITRNGLLPHIFSDDWDDATGTWRVDRPPTVWEGAEEFKRRWLSITLDPETGLLAVVMEWPDPDIAAEWANQMVALANELARQKDIMDAEKSIEYLNKQIADTNVVELERVLYNLLEIELRTLILANARDDYAFQVIDRAVAPIYRAWPKRTLMSLAAIVAGSLLGFVILLFRRVPELLRERESSVSDGPPGRK